MRPARRRSAVMPLRALLVILLLAGFGLWQAWQCSDGRPVSPIAGMPAMTTATGLAPVVQPAQPALNALNAFNALTAEPPASDLREPMADHGMPGGMLGVCITVLASVAAALLLLVLGPRIVALLRRLVASLALLLSPAWLCAPSLTRLCVSRT